MSNRLIANDYKEMVSKLPANTQEKQAEILGINPSTLKRRINGDSLPSWEQVKLTADIVERHVGPLPAEFEGRIRKHHAEALTAQPREQKIQLEAVTRKWYSAERRAKEFEKSLLESRAEVIRLSALVGGSQQDDSEDLNYKSGLRDQLKLAISNMDRALRAYTESVDELRECGRNLAELASRYLHAN